MIKDGATRFIEIGPKKILTNLIQKSHKDIQAESFEDLTLNE